MKRLAILTPDPDEPRYSGRWQQAFERLRAAFSGQGVEAVPTPWTAPSHGADAALAILSWGYHFQLDRWRARIAVDAPPLINPAGVLRWNTRKTYLLELEAADVPIVPTRALATAEPASLDAAYEAFGTDDLVIKPQVSAGSHLTVRATRRAPAPMLPAGPVLVQPFLPAIGAEGELSLFYFGGTFSHAARKVAAEGDFRIQPQFGGQFTLYAPDPEAFSVAGAALAAAPDGISYARVDLIRRSDGRLALMELEAIEPDLYLDLAPEAGERFAKAVTEAMAHA